MNEDLINYLKTLNYKNISIKKVLSDASTRKYYRFSNLNSTFILMQRDSFNADTDRFCLVYKFLKSLDINVAKIYNYDEIKGYMVLEDLGDLTISNFSSSKEALLVKYLDAVNLIIKFQKNKITNVYPVTYKFTFSKLYNELIMTKYYFIEKYKNKNTYNKKYLEFFFASLVKSIMKQKFLLNHRDYHSRNILVFKDTLYLIDFQDARLGPYTYDLASLIIDPYANIDSDMSSILINEYYNNTKFENYDVYLNNFKLVLLQRALKILGTYAFQENVNKNSSYLKYIPRTLKKISKIKSIMPEFENIIEEVILN